MESRGKYKTRQRLQVQACLEDNADRYMTVDDVWDCVSAQGEHVGRSTVYRNLEALVSDRSVLKVTSPAGEARYRLAPEGHAGQLVCLECGRALPLDCGMLGDFAQHVQEHHGFAIEGSSTVLYGRCEQCMQAAAADNADSDAAASAVDAR